MSGQVPDRVPVVPKIWVDLAARMTGTRLTEVIADPLTALRVIVEAGVLCHVDGVRQFHFPKRRVIEKEGKVLEVDDKGRRLGEVDMLGGLMTYLDDARRLSSPRSLHMAHYQYWSSKEPFVRSLEDAAQIAVPKDIL